MNCFGFFFFLRCHCVLQRVKDFTNKLRVAVIVIFPLPLMCAPGRLAFYIAPYLQCLADVIPRLVQWPETGDVGHRRMAEMEPRQSGVLDSAKSGKNTRGRGRSSYLWRKQLCKWSVTVRILWPPPGNRLQRVLVTLLAACCGVYIYKCLLWVTLTGTKVVWILENWIFCSPSIVRCRQAKGVILGEFFFNLQEKY